MSGCYWVSGEWVWQRLMLNRALTLKIKARLPRRDFDMMINQFKMTSLPLLILLLPARIIQPVTFTPLTIAGSFVSRESGSPGKQDICIMLVPPSAGTLTRRPIRRDLFDGILVVAVMAHCTEALCRASTELADLIWCYACSPPVLSCAEWCRCHLVSSWEDHISS